MIASCGSVLSLLNLARRNGAQAARGDATRTGAAPISRNLNDATASLSGWDQTRTYENRVVIGEASDEATHMLYSRLLLQIRRYGNTP